MTEMFDMQTKTTDQLNTTVTEISRLLGETIDKFVREILTDQILKIGQELVRREQDDRASKNPEAGRLCGYAQKIAHNFFANAIIENDKVFLLISPGVTNVPGLLRALQMSGMYARQLSTVKYRVTNRG